MDFGIQMAPKMEPRATNNRDIRCAKVVLGADAVQDLSLDGFWTSCGWILDGFVMVFGCSKVCVISEP